MDVVNIITMGCSKNLVDSERLLRMFEDCGYTVRHNPQSVDEGIVIINTCGFIGDAKAESIDMILECARAKSEGSIQKIFVMGCLSERYRSELPAELPEVDGWYGKFDWHRIISDLGRSPKSKPWERTLTTPPHSAYVKISEGCNRHCAFCAIPIITGPYKSRPIDEILEETEALVARGVKELNILAQDLSFYGKDLYGRHALAELIDRMAAIDGVKWIRLHYAYPTDFPYDVLPVMARHANVCKYLDIALQHISDSQLQRMHRHICAEETRALLARIRHEVPGICLRTTLMVGYPGETQDDFNQLTAFVKEQEFGRLGVFKYCEEDGTPAAKLYKDDVPEEVKEERLNAILEMQEKISEKANKALLGKEITVIIDCFDNDMGAFQARSEADSPDVDQIIELYPEDQPKGIEIVPGNFYAVKITDVLPYEMVGEVLRPA